MKFFAAKTTIDAAPDAIWAILTDGSKYIEWDPNMIRLEGTIAPGEKITIYTKVSPDRAFPITVVEFIPAKKMVWSSGMPLGLFKGERTFLLTPQGNGAVEVSVREEFTGLLAPLITRSIPDLTESFQQFVAGLKKRAEG